MLVCAPRFVLDIRIRCTIVFIVVTSRRSVRFGVALFGGVLSGC